MERSTNKFLMTMNIVIKQATLLASSANFDAFFIRPGKKIVFKHLQQMQSSQIKGPCLIMILCSSGTSLVSGPMTAHACCFGFAFLRSLIGYFNPLSLSINMHVLLSVLHMFLKVLVGRI